MALVENNAAAAVGVGGLGIIINNSSSSSSSSLPHSAFSPNSNLSSSYTDLLHHHTNNHHFNNHTHTHAPVDHPSSSSSSSSSPPTPTPAHQLKMPHRFHLHNHIVGGQQTYYPKLQDRGGGGAFNGNSGFLHHLQRSNTTTTSSTTDLQSNTTTTNAEGFQRDITKLEQLFSNLNPMAQEFVPPSLTNHPSPPSAPAVYYAANNFLTPNTNTITNYPSFDSDSDSDIDIAIAAAAANANNNNNNNTRKKFSFNHGKRKVNSRTSIAQQEDVIRRTVYVSDIDHQVTEEQLAALFVNCGQVVDCRICGDPNSVLRFAFVEFTDEDGATAALNFAGTMLGYYPVTVLPSKTAIAPVDPTFLPRSEDEREMCSRTIYCTNIDKKISQADVKAFFESLCGTVNRLRLLGDYHHSTRIAFVEFVMAEGAILALNCSGVVLGSLPIRVSPSKTPVRPRGPRLQMH